MTSMDNAQHGFGMTRFGLGFRPGFIGKDTAYRSSGMDNAWQEPGEVTAFGYGPGEVPGMDLAWTC